MRRPAPDLTQREYGLWGSSHDWSSKIASASAGRGGGSVATKIARAFLAEIASSEPTSRTLFHGTTTRRGAEPRLGESIHLPLSDDEDVARDFARGGGKEMILRFQRGTPAMRYTDIEWITAGAFRVAGVEEERDPFWGTALLVVTLEAR